MRCAPPHCAPPRPPQWSWNNSSRASGGISEIVMSMPTGLKLFDLVLVATAVIILVIKFVQ